jgi:hypothetical protein
MPATPLPCHSSSMAMANSQSVAARPGDIARDADLDFVPVALDDRHQRQVPHVVDLGQVLELARRQFLQSWT